MVEQRTFNPFVAGSIPALPTKQNKRVTCKRDPFSISASIIWNAILTLVFVFVDARLFQYFL